LGQRGDLLDYPLPVLLSGDRSDLLRRAPLDLDPVRHQSTPSRLSSWTKASNEIVGSAARPSMAARSSASSARRTRTASSTTSERERSVAAALSRRALWRAGSK